jgi:hypothetical protein
VEAPAQEGAADAAPESAPSDSAMGPDASLICGTFLESTTCPDGGGASDAGTCPNSENPNSFDGGFTAAVDGGFAVGCVVDAIDRSEVLDGACMTPTFTCVGTPTPHWQVSWTPWR